MKKLVVAVLAGVVLTGCGVKQQYVNDEIAGSEKRMGAKIDSVNVRTDNNAQDITKLQGLAEELSKKTDIAINKATGFEDYQVIWEGNINFAFDRADIEPVSEPILADAADKMTTTKQSIIEITGHTDAVGSKTYNYLLGDRRANAAKRYLAEKYNIMLSRMFIISFGKDKPVALPDTQNANSKNRRVSLRIWAPAPK